jgi:hypothetical protein
MAIPSGGRHRRRQAARSRQPQNGGAAEMSDSSPRRFELDGLELTDLASLRQLALMAVSPIQALTMTYDP